MSLYQRIAILSYPCSCDISSYKGAKYPPPLSESLFLFFLFNKKAIFFLKTHRRPLSIGRREEEKRKELIVPYLINRDVYWLVPLFLFFFLYLFFHYGLFSISGLIFSFIFLTFHVNTSQKDLIVDFFVSSSKLLLYPFFFIK